jgi:short-subunit dehydrogenase
MRSMLIAPEPALRISACKPTMAILITGIAPHSLGESLVCHLSERTTDKVICIDRSRNQWLETVAPYHHIDADLNPLALAGGMHEFSQTLLTNLDRGLSASHDDHISCIVQCAGTYWSGPFLSLPARKRDQLIGVNLLGHIELLHAAMMANEKRGKDNSKSLIHIEIGSFQGLDIRPGRAVYAVSKAAGLDFAEAVDKEIWRSMYFAPGPLDTYMLHHNHWVVKAGGSEPLLDKLKAGNRDTYRKVFMQCLESELKREAETLGLAIDDCLERFDVYKAQRRNAEFSELGIAEPNDCAKAIVDLITSPDRYDSGAYVARKKRGQTFSVSVCGFAELSRYKAFLAASRDAA